MEGLDLQFCPSVGELDLEFGQISSLHAHMGVGGAKP